MFNFQGPVRRSLAADDLIILPQKRFFVKRFFEKLLKFSELKSLSSFSVLTGTFERSLVLFKGFLLSFQKSFFCLSAWRSSIIPHTGPLVNTFRLLFSYFFLTLLFMKREPALCPCNTGRRTGFPLYLPLYYMIASCFLV